MSTTLVSQSLVESFVIEGGHPLNGRVRAAGQQERRPADHRGVPAHRRACDARERPGHPSTSRRCSSSPPTSASTSSAAAPGRSGSTPGTTPRHELERGAVPPDPSLDPVRRAAARPLRPGGDPTARRRHHRPPAARHPHARLRAARRERAGRPALRHRGRRARRRARSFSTRRRSPARRTPSWPPCSRAARP